MTREQLAAWVTRTRAAQNLPPVIVDRATITQFAVLVADGRREEVATDAAA